MDKWERKIDYKITDISTKLNEMHDKILLRETVDFCNEIKILDYEISIDMLKEALSLYIDKKEREKFFGKDIDVPTKTPGWIPVNERLPEEPICDDGYVEPSDYVLVFGDFGDYGVSRYWGNRRDKSKRPKIYKDWVDLKWITEKPIAWMPLPEPYKEENKAEQGLDYADQDTLMSAT